MLAPDHRSVLIDLLRPPAEMTLDVAVAMTFTLELDAALVAPLAFASFDTDGPGDPIAALEAVRSVGDRLTVFCQAGEIRVPSTSPDLFAFLEPIVYEVKRPRPGRLFHPKLWLLRYRGQDETQSIRLLVPTRNLTNDASWDAVLRLDGMIGGRPIAANRPIADLVRWCTESTTRPLDPKRAASIQDLAESVRRAQWEAPDDVMECAFHVLGLRGQSPPDFTGRRHLVISPFVERKGLDTVAWSDDVTVVSRFDELDRLDPEILSDLSCRTISSVADSGEDDASSVPMLGELHAKLFVAERGRRAHVFVGSANATGAAFGGNIEVLVELIGGASKLGVDATLLDLKAVLEECDVAGGRAETETERLQRELDDLLRDAAVIPTALKLTDAGDGAWSGDVVSTRALLSDGFVGRATLELLTRPGYAIEVPVGAPVTGHFESIPLPDITPFIVLRVELSGPTRTATGSTIVRCRLIDAPPGRLDAVVARQVDSPEKFLRFLFLLLGFAGGAVPPWFQASSNDGSDQSQAVARLLDLGVFETLARALTSRTGGLDDLGRLVDSLRTPPNGLDRLPAGFLELWDAVVVARTAGGLRS